MKNQREIDFNVELARCIAILCIVFHHSISVFAGWPPNNGLPFGLNKFEILLSILCKGVGLGLFSLISGYLARFSIMSKETFIKKIQKRSIRLLVPMLVVGGGYYIFFPHMINEYNPIMGTHLWFIPVIFLCFLFLIVSKVIQVQFSVSIWVPALCFFFIFIFQHYNLRIRLFSSLRTIWPIYVVGYFISANKNYIDHMFSSSFLLYLMIFTGLIPSLFFIYCPMGVVGSITEKCFLLIEAPILFMFLRKIWRNQQLPALAHSISANSFNIYLFHQFAINIVLLFFCEFFYIWPRPFVISFIFGFSVILPLTISQCLHFMLKKQ